MDGNWTNKDVVSFQLSYKIRPLSVNLRGGGGGLRVKENQGRSLGGGKVNGGLLKHFVNIRFSPSVVFLLA